MRLLWEKCAVARKTGCEFRSTFLTTFLLPCKIFDSETNSVSQELRLAYKKSHVGYTRLTVLDSNSMDAGRKLYSIAKKWELREKGPRLARKLREIAVTDEAKNLKNTVPRNTSSAFSNGIWLAIFVDHH